MAQDAVATAARSATTASAAGSTTTTVVRWWNCDRDGSDGDIVIMNFAEYEKVKHGARKLRKNLEAGKKARDGHLQRKNNFNSDRQIQMKNKFDRRAARAIIAAATANGDGDGNGNGNGNNDGHVDDVGVGDGDGDDDDDDDDDSDADGSDGDGEAPVAPVATPAATHDGATPTDPIGTHLVVVSTGNGGGGDDDDDNDNDNDENENNGPGNGNDDDDNNGDKDIINNGVGGNDDDTKDIVVDDVEHDDTGNNTIRVDDTSSIHTTSSRARSTVSDVRRRVEQNSSSSETPPTPERVQTACRHSVARNAAAVKAKAKEEEEERKQQQAEEEAAKLAAAAAEEERKQQVKAKKEEEEERKTNEAKEATTVAEVVRLATIKEEEERKKRGAEEAARLATKKEAERKQVEEAAVDAAKEEGGRKTQEAEEEEVVARIAVASKNKNSRPKKDKWLDRLAKKGNKKTAPPPPVASTFAYAPSRSSKTNNSNNTNNNNKPKPVEEEDRSDGGGADNDENTKAEKDKKFSSQPADLVATITYDDDDNNNSNISDLTEPGSTEVVLSTLSPLSDPTKIDTQSKSNTLLTPRTLPPSTSGTNFHEDQDPKHRQAARQVIRLANRQGIRLAEARKKKKLLSSPIKPNHLRTSFDDTKTRILTEVERQMINEGTSVEVMPRLRRLMEELEGHLLPEYTRKPKDTSAIISGGLKAPPPAKSRYKVKMGISTKVIGLMKSLGISDEVIAKSNVEKLIIVLEGHLRSEYTRNSNDDFVADINTDETRQLRQRGNDGNGNNNNNNIEPSHKDHQVNYHQAVGPDSVINNNNSSRPNRNSSGNQNHGFNQNQAIGADSVINHNSSGMNRLPNQRFDNNSNSDSNLQSLGADSFPNNQNGSRMFQIQNRGVNDNNTFDRPIGVVGNSRPLGVNPPASMASIRSSQHSSQQQHTHQALSRTLAGNANADLMSTGNLKTSDGDDSTKNTSNEEVPTYASVPNDDSSERKNDNLSTEEDQSEFTERTYNEGREQVRLNEFERTQSSTPSSVYTEVTFRETVDDNDEENFTDQTVTDDENETISVENN